MGKRSNDMGQVKKDDYEFQMEQMSGAPKGPFEKASETVLQQRKIVRAARNTAWVYPYSVGVYTMKVLDYEYERMQSEPKSVITIPIHAIA